MSPEFTAIVNYPPGIISSLLRESYVALTQADLRWKEEVHQFDGYDREVFAFPNTVGACLFITVIDARPVGFASWDPRMLPKYAVIGHNCILPEFRGHGLGQLQIQTVLLRLQLLKAETVKVTTCNHPFFIPAQRMYVACGFREVRRFISNISSNEIEIIEYEKSLDAEIAK